MTIYRYTRGMQLSFQFRRHLGPRYIFAGVSLDVAVLDQGFEYVDEAKWPQESYTAAVEEGANAAFREYNVEHTHGLRVVLNRVEYDEVYSDYRSFYLAAKAAIGAYLSINQTPWTECSSSTNPKD